MIRPSKGVRLSVDVGTVRIGIASCDRDQIMASPVATLSGEETAIEEIHKHSLEKDKNSILNFLKNKPPS